tara:strand:- start:62 stop:427 length:366 start_codon:yes stop_codon:yes gene_type:complete
MAFKMKGPMFFKSALKRYQTPQEYKVFNWGNKPTPFDKKDKAKTTMYKKDEDTIVERTEDRKYMDKVYDEVVKYLGKDSEGFSGREIANMTEEERAGNFDDYSPGDFDNLVKEAKERLKNK